MNLLAYCRPWQLEFVNNSEHRSKVLTGLRRQGKTFAAVVKLLKTALENPGAVCGYAHLRASDPEYFFWHLMYKFNKELNLNLVQDKQAWLLPNGSKIIMIDRRLPEDILSLCIVDDALSFYDHRRAVAKGLKAPELISILSDETPEGLARAKSEMK